MIECPGCGTVCKGTLSLHLSSKKARNARCAEKVIAAELAAEQAAQRGQQQAAGVAAAARGAEGPLQHQQLQPADVGAGRRLTQQLVPPGAGGGSQQQAGQEHDSAEQSGKRRRITLSGGISRGSLQLEQQEVQQQAPAEEEALPDEAQDVPAGAQRDDQRGAGQAAASSSAAPGARPAISLSAAALSSGLLRPRAWGNLSARASGRSGGEVTKPRPPARVKLSMVEVNALHVAVALPLKVADQNLRLLHSGHPDEMKNFHDWKSLSDYLLTYTGRNMEVVEIARFGEQSYNAIMLSDPVEGLKRLVQRASERGELAVEAAAAFDGETRVYGRVEQGDDLLAAQKSIFGDGAVPTDSGVLALGYFSDKMKVMTVRGNTYHPVYTWPATIERVHAFKQGNVLLVGYLPIVGRDVRSAHKKHLSEALLHRTLERMFRDIKNAAEVGMWTTVGGRHMNLYPVLSFLAADLQEMAALTASTGSNKSPYPDPSCLVTKDQLSDVGAGLTVGGAIPQKTEAWLQETIDAALAKPVKQRRKFLKSEGLSISLALPPERLFGQELAESSSFPLGVPLVPRLGLSGMKHSDLFRAAESPDGLHMLCEGLAYYLARCKAPNGCVLDWVLQEALTERQAAAAVRSTSAYLQEHCSGYLGKQRMPHNQLNNSEGSGSNFAFMLRCLPPALATIPEAKSLPGQVPGFLELLTDYLSFEALVLRERHTQASIDDMEKALTSFQTRATTDFEGAREWGTLKFFRLALFVKAVKRIGSAHITNTDTRERLHKNLKPSDRHTNNDPANSMAQAARHALLAEAAWEVLDDDAAGKAGREEAAVVAEKEKKASMPVSHGSRVWAVELAKGPGAAAGSEEARLLAGRPLMQHLRYSMTANAITREQVTIYDSMGFPYVKYEGAPITGVSLRANPDYRGKPIFNDVAVSGKCGSTWFGQLVALVDTSLPGETRLPEHQWAYVRWLENASETRASELLGMTRLRWCKQKRLASEVGAAGGGRVKVDYTDLVPLADVLGPVFLQPDASAAGRFFYNHYVR